MTRAFSRAHAAIGCLTLALALLVSHVAAAGELAVLPKPSITADAAAAGAKAVVTTDASVHIFTLPLITLTVLAVNTAVSWWMACALATQALTSSKAGQVGAAPALPQAGVRREGAGDRMLTLLARPALFTVTPPTITLTVTRAEII